ncbi:MAG TPA: site-specific integrase [Chloroflexota bacterium]
MFRDTLRWGLLGRNPCDAVNPPKVTKPELRVLTPEEARRFLAAVAGHRLEALFTLALTTGMRQGELLGLKWQDVDLEMGVVRVRRALQRLRRVGFVEVEPKSATSRRAARLVPLAVTALRRHRARQLEERLQAGTAWEDRDLVFCTEHGRPLTHTTVLRAFWRLLDEAQLPRIRFHDLRHSTATLLLAQGTHPKIVQELLGHSSISLTLDTYSHVLPHLQLEATARLQQLLEG